MKTNEEILAQTIQDEEKYQFTQLSHDDIWDLGCILVEVAKAQIKPLAVEIDMNGTNIFRYLPAGTTANNQLWLERKRKTVQLFEKSSFRVFAEMAETGDTLESRQYLPPSTHGNCGGGFPIRMRNGGCVVGFIGVSGLPHYMDHDVVIEGLERFFQSHPQG